MSNNKEDFDAQVSAFKEKYPDFKPAKPIEVLNLIMTRKNAKEILEGKKKVEYISDANQRARIGQIEDASQSAEYHDVLQQESELTAGHGVLRYTGLIAITAPTEVELESAIAAIEQAAIQASCETRRLVGQQAQAFTAAALPLARTI